MRWYAILFWIWVVGSLVVLVWRRTSRSSPASEEATTRPDPLTREWAPPPSDPAAPIPPTTSPVPPTTPPLPPTTPPLPPTAPPPDATQPPHPLPGSTGRPTLLERVEGIRMPADLVPLTQFAGGVDVASYVVLGTETATAAEVRTGMTGELERLGFAVQPVGPDALVADGPRGRVAVEIHPDPARLVEESGTTRFPTATAGMVVVEMRAE